VTSAYGANLGAPAATVALGTGSVAMRLDHSGQLKQVGGWGFSIGDEGGAATIGKRAVRTMLWELDSTGSEESALSHTIKQKIGITRSEILMWLKSASAPDYARLAPIVSELAPVCPLARTVMLAHGEDVTTLINAVQQGGPLDVILIGGLATATVPYLSQAVQLLLKDAKGTSLDGACLLAIKHVNTLQTLR
jgi:glucosamine kinase